MLTLQHRIRTQILLVESPKLCHCAVQLVLLCLQFVHRSNSPPLNHRQNSREPGAPWRWRCFMAEVLPWYTAWRRPCSCPSTATATANKQKCGHKYHWKLNFNQIHLRHWLCNDVFKLFLINMFLNFVFSLQLTNLESWMWWELCCKPNRIQMEFSCL